MNYILFVVIFLIIANNWVLTAFLGSFTRRKPQKDITDSSFLEKINQKTGLKLKKIYLVESSNFLGAMPGSRMVFTSLAVNSLNKDELEWLALHEAGHHKIFFGLSLVAEELINIVIGIIILMYLKSILLSIILGIILGIIHIQIARINEIAANNYALHRMDNPSAAISAAEKSKKRFWTKGNEKRSIKAWLFDVWGCDIYERLANDAKKEIERRKNL